MTPVQVSKAEGGTAHQEQTRRLVDAMLKLTGHSATGLARSAGLTPSTLNRFMHRRVRHTLSQRTMLALMTQTFLAIKDRPRQSLDAAALAELVPAVAVYERGILERAPDARAALATLTSGAVTGAAGELPVLIAAVTGVNVETADFAQAPLKTQRPPFLEGDPRAFALLMPDASMAPRYDSGDMLYVSPARALDGPSVDVVIERRSGGFTVASLAGHTPDAVRLLKLSPRARETVPREKVRGLWRIVGVQRLG